MERKQEEPGNLPDNVMSDKTLRLLEAAAMRADGAVGIQRLTVNQDILDILKNVWYNGYLEGTIAAIKLDREE
jgi:hypothetical protein